ncbi:DUF4238 domain-containing protein [Gelidibacter gilvus]|nr:DUF4238 domain-containing protein [Gelidibacter gilvus]
MSAYKKQHIVPETYLKHFSINSDGIGIFVINSDDKYRKGIQKKNSGDKIFWIPNYSDTDFFDDRKAIEKMFGTDIENNYNNIINVIEQEKTTIDFGVKQELLQWIFYTKLRSPIWKNHLENFTDYDNFKKQVNDFVSSAVSMRWTIYKSPQNKYWWTSDNPGFCHNLKKMEATQEILPEPIYNKVGVDSILYYPLSKKYCLNIHPYNKGEDLHLNATNTNIRFEKADLSLFKILNYSTLITQKRLIIATESESLNEVEEIKNKT